MTTRLTTDADFLDAEREIAKLRAERTALSPSTTRKGLMGRCPSVCGRFTIRSHYRHLSR
jgi:hypothetical protein